MSGFSKTAGYILSGMIFLSGMLAAGNSWAQVSDAFVNEAKQLAKLEDDYFKKRLNNDLKGAYEYQHPAYKEKISLEEFLFFEGRLVSDYRSGVRNHISGGIINGL